MSEYHDPTYQEAYPPGARAQGGEAVYGDDGPAYGDEGPAYGDHGAYQEEAAYGDEGAYGDQGQVSYGGDYDQADEYDPYADPNQLYADDGTDPYADEGLDPFAEEGAAPAAPPKGVKKAKGGGKPKKPLILAAVGLALVGALGAGGYFLFVAPSSSEGGQASAGFDLSSLTKMIPFMGPKETDETMATQQANLMAVKRAVDTYVKENGKLPSTSSAIESQLTKLGVELSHPYDQNLSVAIELGEAPSAPGVVTYTPKGNSYELRVGDVAGKSLMDGETELVMGGETKGGASKPGAVAAGGAKPAAPASSEPDEPSATHAAKPAQLQAPTQQLPPGMGPDDEDYIETADPVPGTGEASPSTAAKVPAAPPVLLPKATPTPPPTPLAVLRKRNQEFDKLRNQGIGLLYEKRTAEAIVAFRRALLIKPNDPTVRRWLETIQGVVDKHTYEETARLKKDRAELLQRARIVAPPPAPVPDAQRREHDAIKLLDELKEDRAPALAPPRLEN